MVNKDASAYGLVPAVVPVAPGVTIHAFGLGVLYTFDVTVGFTGAKKEEPPAAPVAPPEAAAPKAEPPPEAPEPKTEAPPPAESPAPAPDEP